MQHDRSPFGATSTVLRLGAAICAGLFALAAGIAPAPSAGAPPDPAAVEFFESKVRPLLVERCYACHSAGAKQVMGGLLLDSRDGTLKGGAHGPALVPGSPDAGLLIKAVRYTDPTLHMPPAGKLSEAEIAVLVRWVRMGAPDTRTAANNGSAGAGHPHGMTVEAGRRYWAFLPLAHPNPPDVAALEKASSRASSRQSRGGGRKRTAGKGQNGSSRRRDAAKARDFAAWARTPIDRFILARLQRAGIRPNPPADRRTLIRRAYFDLIGLPPTPQEVAAFLRDRAPNAWEKVVDRLLASPHYGERWGRHWLDLARFAESHGYEQDYDRPNAYTYRDFVIKALNLDLPYDRFVRWQLAGDEIEPDNPLALTATGFLGAGTHATQITKNQVEKERYDELDDMLSTTCLSMLGLTAGCARCHDHKYDPIPTRDYYRMLSTFTTTVRSDVDVKLDPKRYDLIEAHLVHTLKPMTQKAMICSEGVTAIRTHTQGGDYLDQTHFLKRGDPNQKGEVATQSFLQVLVRAPEGEKRWQTPPPSGWRTSYRRRALANWITDVDYGAGGLLARVIVNRLWQHHIGRGIVATPSDFGTQGERPTHPELLDWLATELIRNGWRLKPIHRLILTSSVYLESGATDPKRAQRDPENRLCWRHPKQRLEAEAIRDSLLAVSGLLDTTMYGPGTLDEDQKRRSIYFFIKRSRLIPMMTLFDAPNALQSIAVRSATTIAPQALLIMNGPILREYAHALALRVLPQPISTSTAPSPDFKLLESKTGARQAICNGYQLCLGRDPDRRELADALEFLQQQTASYRAAARPNAAELALTDLCQVILGLNEFLYID